MANKICGNRVGRGFDKEKKKVANGETGRGREIVPKTEQLRKIVKV